MTSETQVPNTHARVQPPNLIQTLFAFKRGRNLGIALAVFAVLAALVLAATAWYENYLAQQTRVLVGHDLAKYKTSLRSSLDTRLATLEGLAAFVAAETATTALPGGNEAEAIEANLMVNAVTYAQGVLQNSALGVQTLALQRPGVPWMVYPALSPSDPIYQALATLTPLSTTASASATNPSQMWLSAPFEMTPGQLGLVAYKPILKNNAVWGTAAIVMDVERLLAGSGFTATDRVQRVTGLRDSQGQWLLGDASSLQHEPLLVGVSMPNGEWALAGQPADAILETNRFHIGLIRTIALIIAFLSSKLVLLALVRQTRLEALVDERVNELDQVNTALARDVAERSRAEQNLRDSQAQYQALLSAIPDLMFRIDRDSRFIGYNARNDDDLFVPAEQFLHKRLDEVLPPHIAGQFEGAAQRALETGSVQVIEYDLALPDDPASSRHFESRICAVGPDETLSLVRDITERKLAYQDLEQRVNERTRELTALLNVSRQMVSTLELRPLLSLVLDHTDALIGFDIAVILKPHDEQFVYLDYRGFETHETLIGTQADPAVVFAVQQVIAEDNAGFVADLFGDDVEAQKLTSHLPPWVLQHIAGMHAALGVPMEVKERVIGVMLLMHHQPGYYTESHVKLATGIADQAAVAMENAHLYEQAQGMAVIEERQRLARDLHDAVTQTLFSATLIAEVLPKIWHKDPKETERRLEELRWFTRGALAEMRMLLLELRPTGLTNTTLGELLRQLADAATARTRFPILLQAQSTATLPPNIQIAFYRVAQEALNNVWKHAQASQVRVRLSLTPFEVTEVPYRNGTASTSANAQHGLESGVNSPITLARAAADQTPSSQPRKARHAKLEIVDNGIGFHPDRVPASHLGLAIMRERAADIQAHISIESAPGQGTAIILEWYCPPVSVIAKSGPSKSQSTASNGTE